ncbi:hypothetical protein IFM89_005110 [Coptis chinensis]|uniref:GCK domain-containing protein n=1 Tax=Coptis chinensis TaxID=261450 RepID=A0A835IJK9_9MAGN|nr:hypothetical protein IFM89_005110 [Coptis chinensis]
MASAVETNPEQNQESIEEDPSNASIDEKKVEEEEEGECGFCLYMKGGGCKDSFIAWENCIKEAEEAKEDIAEKCYQVTAALKTCMEAHPDYYEPILRAEKVAEQEAMKELEKEAELKDKSVEKELVEEPGQEAASEDKRES